MKLPIKCVNALGGKFAGLISFFSLNESVGTVAE